MLTVFGVFRLSPEYEKRVFGLDLMRSIAIIIVVMSHGLMLEKANTNFPWIRLVNGVELFFVLSGFLIGGMLLKIHSTTGFNTFSELKNFWIRRWFRTLPNYYLVLILNIIFVYFGIIGGDFSQFNWKFFFFLHNFSEPFLGFFWESWSLSIEEWFYIFFPLILIICSFAGLRLKISGKWVFLIAILLFLFVPLIIRMVYTPKMNVDSFWLGVNIQKVVIYRLDCIAFGLLAAYAKFWFPKFWFSIRNYSFVAGITVIYFLLYSTWEPNDYGTKVFYLFLQSFGCMLLLPKFDSMKTAPLVLTKIVTHISLISYSMYLINLALVAQVITKNFPPQMATGAWISYEIYWTIVIVFSTLLYKYFEKPMTELRERF